MSKEKATKKATKKKRNPGGIGAVLKKVIGFIKQYIDLNVEIVKVDGRHYRCIINFGLRRITRRPITQTEAAKVIHQIHEGDRRALIRNRAIHTGNALHAIRVAKRNISEAKNKDNGGT